MYRLNDGTYPAERVELMARAIGLDPDKLPGAIVRCSHGYKSDEQCDICESGMASDGSQFAAFKGCPAVDPGTGEYLMEAVDADWAHYVPHRYQSKVDRAYLGMN